MIVMVIIYTHLAVAPFWFVLLMNVLFMIGIMSRMVPAMALNTSLPEVKDRGAYMSINSSLQQIAGGLAAAVGGMVVVQKTKTSPLEHYDTLGYVIVGLTIISVYMLYRMSRMIKDQQQQLSKESNIPQTAVV